MSDIAIRVENLGKAYKIAHNASVSRYKTLQEDVIGLLKRPFSRERQSTSEIFWALKDISFEVKQGEVLGIIGRNGAGKSTLLKILSRITRPTTGYAEMHGRIGSLLEVGTGFHPELTGRENIYLSGAVLGMTRRDIDRRFDEIVAFADVEKFLDTPAKRYSSGMYMRLAFAVAAHLEPEILVVDEVLAVGDAEFQKKSLGKMDEVAKSGRTVLFVSHNMGAVTALCSKAMLLDHGTCARYGNTSAIVQKYSEAAEAKVQVGSVDLTANNTRMVSSPLRFTKARVHDDAGETRTNFLMGENLHFEIGLFSRESISKANLVIHFDTATGTPVMHLMSMEDDFQFETQPGESRVKVRIPNIRLFPGNYSISLWAGDFGWAKLDEANDCLAIQISEGHLAKAANLSWKFGIFYQDAEWADVTPVESSY